MLARNLEPGMPQHHPLSRRFLLAGLTLLGTGLTQAARAAGKTGIAVAEFDYVDSSGEPADQIAAHEKRLSGFTQSLRDAVAHAPNTRLVTLPCRPAACSAETLAADDLMVLAKKTDATLLLFGGIHKISTLIEFASIELADVKTGKSVLHRSVTFRGDSDEAWQHAAAFCASMVLAAA
jgi:hypothetical protein